MRFQEALMNELCRLAMLPNETEEKLEQMGILKAAMLPAERVARDAAVAARNKRLGLKPPPPPEPPYSKEDYQLPGVPAAPKAPKSIGERVMSLFKLSSVPGEDIESLQGLPPEERLKKWTALREKHKAEPHPEPSEGRRARKNILSERRSAAAPPAQGIMGLFRRGIAKFSEFHCGFLEEVLKVSEMWKTQFAPGVSVKASEKVPERLQGVLEMARRHRKMKGRSMRSATPQPLPEPSHTSEPVSAPM
jgi:hypothetical protein